MLSSPAVAQFPGSLQLRLGFGTIPKLPPTPAENDPGAKGGEGGKGEKSYEQQVIDSKDFDPSEKPWFSAGAIAFANKVPEQPHPSQPASHSPLIATPSDPRQD